MQGGSTPAYAQKKGDPVDLISTPQKSDAKSLIDYKSIKDVLVNDNLDQVVKERKRRKKRASVLRTKRLISTYDFPSRENFWPFFSEYWLVKSVQKLKWNFTKPDYGLDSSFKKMLEKIGFLEKQFKVMLLDTNEITHVALPGSDQSYIILLSLPFIRTMDLTKLEISLLLFEDFIRARMGYFENYATSKELQKLFGQNYYQKKLPKSLFQDLLAKYDKIVFSDGFTFQQQFEVTTEVAKLLKGNEKFVLAYRRLIGKIDNLVKRDKSYKNYNQLYPSPELQLNWLNGGGVAPRR
ncbi:MAG: hypothetical protein HN353_00985 [Bdellovibrionales bacterium]|jgi:hypothetical protein|nr:hypothetical protein [Bdellovibrionales bacterium]MBT3526756.1 hypothetical protein [Bdellovibrionales bacterium]MBT7668599.1 hypothetical protein [Bdellovibrionales bacterium]MBT7767737.1 hypothetical protein [Bdellovibrionales bacterium]